MKLWFSYTKLSKFWNKIFNFAPGPPIPGDSPAEGLDITRTNSPHITAVSMLPCPPALWFQSQPLSYLLRDILHILVVDYLMQWFWPEGLDITQTKSPHITVVSMLLCLPALLFRSQPLSYLLRYQRPSWILAINGDILYICLIPLI